MRLEVVQLLPLSELPAGGRVLDLGCGAGSVDYASFPHLRFFGSDQYPDAGTAGWPRNAWLALADAERLPYATAVFDAAICVFAFEHFKDPRAALREIDRVLRYGAFLFISVPRAASIQDRLYRFALKGGGHLQRYSFETFVSMVYQETGFKLYGYAPARAGYTWLRDVPYGDTLYRLLFRSFRAWAQVRRNPLEASDYWMLFRLRGSRGYRVVEYVCAGCGKEVEDPQGEEARWVCPVCSFENIRVGGPSTGPKHPSESKARGAGLR